MMMVDAGGGIAGVFNVVTVPRDERFPGARGSLPPQGYLSPHHYDQIFTVHGVIMTFFVAMPLITGVMNFVVPLQIGARDVAFPLLNNFSFWMTAAGAVIVMLSLFIGEFARTGWLVYPPLSETARRGEAADRK